VTQVSAAIEETMEQELEDLRRPLLAFCYRMLGSSHDAEDAVQETMIRAWRALGRLDDRAGLRPWVYKIATNVCVDAANDRRRRALPMDLNAPDDGRGALGAPLPESVWISPIPSWHLLANDPAEWAVSRETIRLAFVAALQHLLPRQRAVLILRDVLHWRAAEVAALLNTSVDAVHSTLRRARAALAHARRDGPTPPAGNESVDARLLQQYIDAFERFDIDGIVSMLHRDVVVSMPPFSFWLHGKDAFRIWLESNAAACGHGRLVPTDANGSPAVALYRPGARGLLEPSGLHLPQWHAGKVTALHVFLQPELFPLFGLPPTVRPALGHPQLPSG
jgi:RNA polymerase sigma-70 factor, ECF subfamily